MKLFNTEGIVIRSQKFGDADSILLLLTKNHGLVSAMAKGVRKLKSKNRSGVSLFSHSHFSLFPGRSMYHINHSDSIKVFAKIYEDVQCYSVASYWGELVEAFLLNPEDSESIFILFLTCMHALGHIPEEMLIRYFEGKLLQLLGFEPGLNFCVSCGKKQGTFHNFCGHQGGVLCSDCSAAGGRVLRVSPGSVKVLEKLLASEPIELLRLKPSALNYQEIKSMNGAIIRHHTNKSFKSLEFLDEIQG